MSFGRPAGLRFGERKEKCHGGRTGEDFFEGRAALAPATPRAVGAPILIAVAIGIWGCGGQGKVTGAQEAPTRPPARHANERPGPGTRYQRRIALDAGFAAHQRYYNRIDETVQFGESDPAKNPHPVAHVGERSIDNSAASWIPALGSLLAVRGNRWLTVTIAVAGRPGRQVRDDDAASLARLGFKLTA
jgi:hypothetical protein